MTTARSKLTRKDSLQPSRHRATITPLENGRARVRLHEPQRAVTPGQAAVIYDGDIVAWWRLDLPAEARVV